MICDEERKSKSHNRRRNRDITLQLGAGNKTPTESPQLLVLDFSSVLGGGGGFLAVQLEAMGDVGAYVKKVADQLWAYRLCNNGGVPKRTSDCKEERSLAMDVAKLRVRCHKSLGPKPKESQLNQEEVAYLTEKLQGPIPVADATSEMGASSADVQGTGRSRWRAVVGPATTGAVGQTNAIQGSGAEHVAPVAVGHAAAPAAPATGHERNQRRPQGSAPEVRSGPGARQSAPRATVEARAAGAGTCCTLPGLNINWPFSQLILAGVKTAEARSYDLGHHNIAHPHVEMWLVETPGDPQALAKGMALDGDARIAPRPQHAQIVGTLTFSRADRYESLESFRSERECHRIGQGGKYDWHGEGDMYAWRVSGTRRLVQPVPQPGRKGVTGFAKPRPHTVLFADGAHPAPRSSGEGAACTPAPPGGGRQQRTLTGGRSLRIVGYHGKGKGKDGKGKGKDGKGKGGGGKGRGHNS